MIAALLEPFGFAFMRDALLIGAIVAIPTALLSCFLVPRGWALMGDAVSHGALPGIVLAHVLGLPLILGAFGAGLLTTLATGYLAANGRVKRDTVMGVVFSGMFGLGIVLHTSITSDTHLDHILFGNMLGIGARELWTTGAIAFLVTAGLLAKWRDLMLHAFDPAQARASGLPVGLLGYGFLAALSLTITATLSATGLILGVGLLIAPGAIAFLTVRGLARMRAVSCLVCLGATLGGVYLSFFLDSAPAPTIILILTALFVAAFLHRARRARRATSLPETPGE